jgi:hypothetical protein
MSKTIYKTAQGRLIDVGAMLLQNEKTRAVGNMKVNARGDHIDSENNIISSRTQQATKNYNRQAAQTVKPSTPPPAKPTVKPPTRPAAAPAEQQQKLPETNETVKGLAAAMARAQQIKDED